MLFFVDGNHPGTIYLGVQRDVSNVNIRGGFPMTLKCAKRYLKTVAYDELPPVARNLINPDNSPSYGGSQDKEKVSDITRDWCCEKCQSMPGHECLMDKPPLKLSISGESQNVSGLIAALQDAITTLAGWDRLDFEAQPMREVAPKSELDVDPYSFDLEVKA